MFQAFASTQTMIATTLFVMLIVLLGQAVRWRSLEAKKIYLDQCNVALQFPRFSNPELMKLDLRTKTADGEADTFEAYEWFVARFVYALEEVLRLWPSDQWHSVAETQLGNHKPYFASEYYIKQNYLPHYSRRMRGLIQKQRGQK